MRMLRAMMLPVLPTSVPRSIKSVRVLRISVTDRCNLRCVYCMPERGIEWLSQERLLSFEQICDVVRAAVEVHGITRFKLTGGEPTVRSHLCDLVVMLRRIDGIDDLSLTTNGTRLASMARPLKQAGLDRVTVSLDSLIPQRFRQITRRGDLHAVLSGLDAAEAAGLLPLKVNCVMMRGINDDEFVDFARLSIARRLTVRLIEYMPLGDAAAAHVSEHRGDGICEPGPGGGCGVQDRGKGLFISESDAREKIEVSLGPMVRIPRAFESGVGPAVVYRLATGNPLGRIGFISAMSKPFCSSCNRLRLTANGMLQSCLIDGGETPIRSLVQLPAGTRRRNHLANAMSECVKLKPAFHREFGSGAMSRIGG
jgi:cyclic pyranopterin phosphate synthase